jgi:hypothetical protein
MINKFFVILNLFFLLNINCNTKENEIMVMKGNENMIKNENSPIYELYIDARGCYFELLVNEVPVYFHYNIGATAFRLPINNYIPKSGEQKISYKLISVVEGKPFPEGAEILLEIDKYPKETPRERVSILKYKSPEFKQDNSGLFVSEVPFHAQVPYELVLWDTGVDLSKENKDELRKDLEAKYIEYTSTFQNNDLEGYKKLTSLRQKNAFMSMYYTKDQISLAEKSYLDGIPKETVKFFPLENYQLVFYGGGKLVGLQKLNEAPGIYIDNEDETEAFMEYILFYRKDTNSPLEIIF